MQGMIAVLLAMGGMGCHYKACYDMAPSYCPPPVVTCDPCLGGFAATPAVFDTGCGGCGTGCWGAPSWSAYAGAPAWGYGCLPRGPRCGLFGCLGRGWGRGWGCGGGCGYGGGLASACCSPSFYSSPIVYGPVCGDCGYTGAYTVTGTVTGSVIASGQTVATSQSVTSAPQMPPVPAK